MIPDSLTLHSTVYTVMTNVQKMTRLLGQKTSVITFDEAIYCKAKEIQWRCPEEFSDLVLRLGGFHMVLVFLASIGKLYQSSGLEDILIESDTYGATTVDQFLKGKSYNRGVRAHKLVLEALSRLRWKAFGEWLVTSSDIIKNCDLDRVLQLTEACAEQLLMGTQDGINVAVENLVKELPPLLELLDKFCNEGKEKSQTFSFWDNYIDMIHCLLDFIRGEREGHWELHLASVAKMIPYFFAADRVNYARWACVYLADMKKLPFTAASVHQEFLDGNHPVKRSRQRFNQVWTDMALEQSANRDSKTKGGIIGISKQPGALNRWFLTAHERASATTATKKMAGLAESESKSEECKHKETGPQRRMRDEKDVHQIVTMVNTQMINPFSNDQPQTLCNIATGVVAPENVSKDLTNACSTGRKAMMSFVEERLCKGTMPFYNAIHKLKLKTFSSVKVKKQVQNTADRLAAVDADRELFSRILVVANTRNVNLRDVFLHELSSVPYSIAHIDGTLRKVAKSTLLAELEKKIATRSCLPYTESVA